MKEEDLNKAREEYYLQVKQKEKLLAYKNELAELSKDKNVRRYLDLLELVEDYVEPSNEDMVKRAFSMTKSQHKTHSNQIMVYIGTYIRNKNLYHLDDQITYNSDPKASYKAYLDLETQEIYNIKLNQYEEFEHEYLTLYIPVAEYSRNEYMKNFFKLQQWFFNELITRSQKDVIKELQEIGGRKYKNLYNACHNYQQLQLDKDESKIVDDFDPMEFIEKHPENGFVEEFCLSDENRKRVKLYRRNNKINSK